MGCFTLGVMHDSASIVLRGFMSYNNKTCEITMHSGLPKLWVTDVHSG